MTVYKGLQVAILESFFGKQDLAATEETNQSMKYALQLRQTLAAVVLLGAALGCSAFSLGRVQGGVWVGQPIDLRIQVNLGAGDDPAALCFALDVFHSDARVSSNQVRMSVEPGQSRNDLSLRVQSAVLVDEPVVTINLKAGCVQTVTRRYVLLADILSEGAVLLSVPKATPVGVSGTTPAAGKELVPGGVTGAAVARIKSGVKFDGDVSQQRKPLVAARPTSTGPATPVLGNLVRRPSPDLLAAKSRLKLGPVEFLNERDLVLRASNELLTVPAQGGLRREQAAALWRAINATPEEILRDAQQFQSLQADVAAMRVLSQKNETAVADLTARQEGVLAERYGKVLVFGLLIALIAATGAAAYFWRLGHRQRQPHWWDGSRHDVHESKNDAGPDSAPDHRKPVARPGSNVMVGVNSQTSQTVGNRAVKVAELLEVQQQADFFISLGQYDQGVAILRKHISEKADTNALLYFDLLKIFHLQGRQQDYDLVCREFTGVFNVKVPEFADFGQPSRGLETYQNIMSQIVELWPSEKVLNVIEESIFCKPGRDHQAFDSEAYRDLLLLYSVARELIDSGAGSKP
ncbi:MAG: hypothetical protein PHH58_14225 [Rhodoferax sp.]|nr:hypothetical protein [Rhodoferax sp.]